MEDDRVSQPAADTAESPRLAGRLRFLFTIVLSAWTAFLVYRLADLLVFHSPGHDQNWLLLTAQRMLSGAQLYGPRIAENNPPLIIWFSAIPVLLSRVLHIPPDQALKLLVLIMISGSIVWCVRIFRIAGWARLPISTSLAIYALVTAETWIGGSDFGQREHLVILLVLPYILSAATGAAAKLSFSERCAIGLLGGVAVCFKPQQVLIIVGLEIFLAVWKRSLHRFTSSDFLSAIFAVCAYIGLVSVFAPLYFQMMPILRDTFWAYESATVWNTIKGVPTSNFQLLLILILFILQKQKLRFAALPGSLLACSCGAMIAFDIQHAPWMYLFYPQQALLILAALFIFIDLPPSVTSLAGGWRFNSAFAVLTLAMLAVVLPVQVHLEHRIQQLSLKYQPYSYQVFAQYPPHASVYVFSTNVSDAFPAVTRDHLVWASRFPALWMLPAIIENEAAEAGGPPPAKRLPLQTVEQLARLQRTETAEDFRRWKPAVVIVKQCIGGVYCHGLERFNFHPLPWFLKSPVFAAEWSHYRLQAHHGIYDIYKRIQ